jgi:hypothetical protein
MGMDVDLQRIHEVESASERFDDGLLDGPEQGRCPSPIAARPSQGVLQFLCMEDSVAGVISLEFGGFCHVDPNVEPIPAEGRPDSATAFAEGNSRPAMVAHEETGLAKRVMDHPERKGRSDSCSVGLHPAVHRNQAIPQNRNQPVLGFFFVRYTSMEGFCVQWQGRIEDRPRSMNAIHGMDVYSFAIFCHIHSHLSIHSKKPH